MILTGPESFSLRRVYRYFRGTEATEQPLEERLVYRFDRHSITTGALLGERLRAELRNDVLRDVVAPCARQLLSALRPAARDAANRAQRARRC